MKIQGNCFYVLFCWVMPKTNIQATMTELYFLFCDRRYFMIEEWWRCWLSLRHIICGYRYSWMLAVQYYITIFQKSLWYHSFSAKMRNEIILISRHSSWCILLLHIFWLFCSYFPSNIYRSQKLVFLCTCR